MKLPLQVTFRNMDPSEALEQNIRERAEKLNHFYDRLMSCRVMVEAQHRHHRQGNLYHVRLDLTVPGGELAVSRDPAQDHAHEDVYVAVRDAFDAARRRLEDFARRQRQEVKTHAAPALGRVAQLYPAEDYGIIETPDGREIRFRRDSLGEREFDRLAIGDEVTFDEEAGAEGPEASTVTPKGQRHV
ncbi:HPF/RaiA family ribosome-associated protein [Candidatus Methylocalor cossyra]|uniref:Cold-shock protein DNA-binding protein n=1 Tax=Candidatus Methylocalor cossyra TaxID=3108543 RepID=A0ABM9NF12_9GAMM